MSGLVDANDRSKALTTFDRNLVVTAGAGTGKTALLVGRLVAALVKRHIEPSAVLALTFTENAAAEMRERLLRVLRAAEPFVDGDEIAEASDRFTLQDTKIGREELPRVRELLARSEELQVQTFHGFCMRLLQQRARDLGLPPRIQLLNDDNERRSRLDIAFARFLEDLPADDLPPALQRFDASALITVATALASGIPHEARQSERLTPSPGALDGLEARIVRLEEQTSWGRAAFRAYLAGLRSIVQDLRAGDQPRELPKPGRCGKVEARKALDVDKDIAGPLCDRIDREAKELGDELKIFVEAEDPAIEEALAFLEPFLVKWRTDRLHVGILDFDDLIVTARDALRTDPTLRDEVASRYETILVDEFQDTDPLQYDIVFLLAAAKGAGTPTDPLTVPLRPCLFLVGDAKQSIYRFRRADLSAFARVQRIILDAGGEALSLRANFRSVPSVLSFVNDAGSRTIEENLPYQAAFEPVVPQLDDEPRKVEIWAPTPRADDEQAPNTAARRKREGTWVVDWILEQARDGVAYGRQAILLRVIHDLGWLLSALRRAGIPYVLQGSRRFYDRYETQLASALVLAVARPWDSVPVLGVLRSGFVGASDGEIFDYLQRDDVRRSLNPASVPADASGTVADGLRWLRDLVERGSSMPVHSALEMLLTLEQWPIVVGSGFEGAQCHANLERLRQQLRRSGVHDLTEAANLLERRVLTQFDDEEAPLYDAGADVDAVRILSAHGSKGLEFDAVLIPDCATGTNKQPEVAAGDATRLFTDDGRVLLAVKIGDAANAAALQVNKDSRPHSDAEGMRLFYVAATRARKRLTLLFTDEDNASAGSWQRTLQDVGIGNDDGDQASWAIRHRRPGTAAPAAVRPEKGFTTRILDAMRRTSVERPPARPATPAGRSRLRGAALLGSELHEYLRLVRPHTHRLDKQLLARCTRSIGEREPTGELLAMAERFHASSLRTRMVRAASCLREIPATWLDTDGPRYGIIDLALEEGEGQWTVIDYKTDQVESGGEAVAAIRHAEQLKGYATALAQALELPATPGAAVWFARTDQLVEIP